MEHAPRFPAVKLSWADGGYAGKLVTWAKKALKLTVQIVRRPDDLHTFQVLPRRWVVERTLAWITRCRRTVRHYERLTEHHETIVYWAMIITMSRRLARSQQPTPAPRRLVPDRLLDMGKRLAQRVKTHSAQAECLGVKILEAEGSSGPCHGILPGL